MVAGGEHLLITSKGGEQISKPTSAQCARIIDYLEDGNTLTSLEAWRKLGVARLASRIYDLRQAGYPIVKEPVTVENRFGEKVTIKRYYLQKDE